MARMGGGRVARPNCVVETVRGNYVRRGRRGQAWSGVEVVHLFTFLVSEMIEMKRTSHFLYAMS